MSATGATINAVGEGAVSNILPSSGMMSTSAQISAVFYVLVIFFVAWLFTTFNLWSKIQSVADATGASSSSSAPAGTASHMDNGSINLTSGNLGTNALYQTNTSTNSGSQVFSGFNPFRSGFGGVVQNRAPIGAKGILTNQMMASGVAKYN